MRAVGDRQTGTIRPEFDRSISIDFQGAKITASGARVIMNLMYELRRRGGLCAGWNLRRSGPGICMHHKSLNKEHGNEYGIHQS